MKWWKPGQSPAQQAMQNAQAQARAQWQRNLQGGWFLQQKAKMNEVLLKNALTRRTSLSSRIPSSLSDLGLENRQAQSGLALKPQSPITIKPRRQLKPSAAIDKIWANHNVERSDRQEMQIHIAFSVANLLEHTGTVAAYFYFSNGVPLKDFNGDYRTKTGNVCVARRFMPKSPDTSYEDFVLFMPYLELHMGPGNHSLKFSVSVWDDRNRELAWADGPPFTYASTSG